jgi:hypothetical protein
MKCPPPPKYFDPSTEWFWGERDNALFGQVSERQQLIAMNPNVSRDQAKGSGHCDMLSVFDSLRVPQTDPEMVEKQKEEVREKRGKQLAEKDSSYFGFFEEARKSGKRTAGFSFEKDQTFCRDDDKPWAFLKRPVDWDSYNFEKCSKYGNHVLFAQTGNDEKSKDQSFTIRSLFKQQ